MLQISPLEIHKIANRVNAAIHRLPNLGPELKEKGKLGCSIAVIDPAGDMVLQTVIGTKPSNCVDTNAFAREKIGRLMFRHRQDGHILSRQSENKQEQQYAGAVLLPQEDGKPGWGASVSAYPSHGDELFSLSLLCQIGAITTVQAYQTVGKFPNDYWDPHSTFHHALFKTF